jgi:hypothetical protein
MLYLGDLIGRWQVSHGGLAHGIDCLSLKQVASWEQGKPGQGDLAARRGQMFEIVGEQDSITKAAALAVGTNVGRDRKWSRRDALSPDA